MSNNTLKTHNNTIMNKTVRLTEQDLHNIVKESVENVLMENVENEGTWDNIKSGWNGAKNAYNYSKRRSEINQDREKEIHNNPGGYYDYNGWERANNNATPKHMSNDVSTILTYIRRMNITINDAFVKQLTQALQNIISVRGNQVSTYRY